MEWLNQLTPQQRAVANKVAAEADRQGVPRELALAAAMQESKFNQKAKSKTGPVGVMQLGKAAANEQGVNRHNMDQNIKGGVGYLKQMLVQQNGDPQRALIAYHDGPSSPFFKGGNMSPEAYNHLQKVKAYGGFQGDVIPMATNTSTGVSIADIEPVPDIPLFTMGETVGRPRDARDARDVAAGVAGAGLGSKFGQNVMPSHREQQLMQAARRLDLLESKQAIDAANAAKVRTFGSDVANWHPGQYREDISRNIINPSSQADAAEQARQLEARAKAAQRFGQTVQAGPESRIQIPVEAGSGPRGGPGKTAMPTSVIPEAPVAPAAAETKPFLRSARFPGGGALNVLGGAGAAAQLYDAYERYKEGDYPGAALGAISGVGGGVGTFFPNPVVQAIGGGVGLAGAGAQYLYDKYREDQEAKKQQAAKPNMAEGGLARLPKFAGRGESLVGLGKAAVKKGEQLIGRESPGLFVPRPTRVTTMSEALGPHEGKYLGLTQTDNFGVHGDRMGGNQFPNFQNISPAHQEAGVTWMNDSEKHANDLVKNRRFNNKDVVYSTYIGAPDQLKSNKTVTNDILNEHYKRTLTPEQYDLINQRIATLKDSNGRLVFPQAFDIRDRFATKELGTDTFARRSALASMLGEGEGVGRTKQGIALPQYQDILRSHRDPLTEGVPTSSVGTRIFTVDDRPAMFTKEFHPDYDWAVFGKDQQVQFPPVPQRLAVHDWHSKYKERFPTKEPHGNAWFSYSKDPQFIDEAYLTRLQKEGYAGGGIVNALRKALPAAERKANLEKFLAPSQEKRVMYHGSLGDINKFNPNNRITFLTPEPSFANSFASKSFDPVEGQSLGANPPIKPGANVMPVHVQAENIFDPYNPAHQNALHDKLMENYGRDFGSHDIRRMVYDASNKYDNWQGVENHMVQNAIKDLGHDAFISTENGVRNLGVYDPRRIKSAIGNEGTYNTRDLDVTKAEGGLIHLQSGGNPKVQLAKRLAGSTYDMLGLTPESVAAWRKANAKPYKQQQDPVLAKALDAYLTKQISQEDYLRIMNERRPIRPLMAVPGSHSNADIASALDQTKAEKGILGLNLQVPEGTRVGNRLDIPAYERYGVYVDTMHDPAGKPIGYGHTGHLKDVEFKSSPTRAARVGLGTKEQGLTPLASTEGQGKSPFAMMVGNQVNTSDDEVRRMMAEAIKDPAWHQIGMNPYRGSQFYDKADMKPVWSAKEKIQAGPLVLARDLEKTDWTDPRLLTEFGVNYKEGGLVGLYANIHAKQERIKHGSGEKMRKPGTEGAPTAEAFRESAKTAKMKKGGQVNLSVGRGEKLPVDQGAGLTAKGRAKYNRETGSHLQAPQPEGGPRKDSFCARMEGVVEHSKGDAPRAKAALERWKC